MTSIEKKAYRWMSKHSVTLLRVGIGIVFFWFGIQKFFPGMSSAEDLATRTIEVMTFGLIEQSVGMFLLAFWEVIIGITFIFGIYMRIAIPLLFLQMIGTITPLFFFPEETFTMIPVVPNIIGQYIIKNIVLIAAGMVIGAHHFGYLTHRQER